jgi:hypothetical protein
MQVTAVSARLLNSASQAVVVPDTKCSGVTFPILLMPGNTITCTVFMDADVSSATQLGILVPTATSGLFGSTQGTSVVGQPVSIHHVG